MHPSHHVSELELLWSNRLFQLLLAVVYFSQSSDVWKCVLQNGDKKQVR